MAEKTLQELLEDTYVELVHNESHFKVLKDKIEATLELFYQTHPQKPEFQPHPDIRSLLDGTSFQPQLTTAYLHPLKRYMVVKVLSSNETGIVYQNVGAHVGNRVEVQRQHLPDGIQTDKYYMIHEAQIPGVKRAWDWAEEVKNPVNIAKALARPFAEAKQNKVRY